MNLASGGFYTSDIFWTGAGAVVALVVGVAGVWAALRSSNPKRRRPGLNARRYPLALIGRTCPKTWRYAAQGRYWRSRNS